ncbi:MAG: DUF4258 domain-containing protein [Candidatus Stahlbacteria bacterium]|nr:DUF4258 domain-containing protein [Candidatus Stahlbacteria bacterium]
MEGNIDSNKAIYFTKHSLMQMQNRKADKEEVENVIRKSLWKFAEKGRFTASLSFPFNTEHFGRYYKTKEVVPIFIEEKDRIVVITVYTFFSQKEEEGL